MKVIRAELLNYVIDLVLRSDALFSRGRIIENASGELAVMGEKQCELDMWICEAALFGLPSV